MALSGSYIRHPLDLEGAPLDQGVEFWDDFLHGEPNSSADVNGWLATLNSGTVAIADDELNGVCTATSSSTNELNLQVNGEPFSLSANPYREIHFEARVNLTDHDGMSWFVGIGITDTAVWTTSFTDWVGFYGVNEANINIGAAKDGSDVPGSGSAATETSSDSGIDAASDSWIVLKFIVKGTTEVRYWVDGAIAGSITTTLPDNEALTPTIAFVGSAETVDIDYVWCFMDRETAA